jgi:hypothetical protein
MSYPILNTVLLEGHIRSYKGEWILETHDRKLYKIADLFDRFEGKEARLIVAEIADVQELQTVYQGQHATTDEEREEEG